MDSKIRRQVEYYFADFNLMRDVFLKNEIKMSKENGKDGFIDLDIMLKFNRLAQLTTDKEKIAASLSDSKLVELNESKDSVRRNPENKLPIDDEIYRTGLKNRTVYVEKLPRDDGAKGEVEPATLDEIFDYLYAMDLDGETVNLRKCKAPSKPNINGLFDGSCFITFRTAADVTKFLESDVKFRETYDLTKMTKSAYWTRENAKRKAQKAGTDVDQAIAAAKDKQEDEQAPTFQPGNVLVFTGINDATTRREDVKNFLVENHAAVDFMAYEAGQGSGKVLINLEHGKSPEDIFKDGKYTTNIKGDEVTFKVGEEADYSSIAVEYIAFKKRMAENRQNRRGGRSGGRGRGGRGRGRGDRNDRNNRNNRNHERRNTRKTFGDSGDEAGNDKTAKEPFNGDAPNVPVTEIKSDKTNGHNNSELINSEQTASSNEKSATKRPAEQSDSAPEAKVVKAE